MINCLTSCIFCSLEITFVIFLINFIKTNLDQWASFVMIFFLATLLNLIICGMSNQSTEVKIFQGNYLQTKKITYLVSNHLIVTNLPAKIINITNGTPVKIKQIRYLDFMGAQNSMEIKIVK